MLFTGWIVIKLGNETVLMGMGIPKILKRLVTLILLIKYSEAWWRPWYLCSDHCCRFFKNSSKISRSISRWPPTQRLKSVSIAVGNVLVCLATSFIISISTRFIYSFKRNVLNFNPRCDVINPLHTSPDTYFILHFLADGYLLRPTSHISHLWRNDLFQIINFMCTMLIEHPLNLTQSSRAINW